MADLPNNVYGSIQNMLGGSQGYTLFRPAPQEEIQISGTLNVVTDQGTVGDVQVNGVSIAGVLTVPNQVIIRELADFPAPISSVINLVADTQYYIQGTVDCGTNQLDFAGDNISFRGVEKRVTSLVSNTSLPMFITTSNTSMTMKNLTLQQNGSGALLEIIISTNSRFDMFNMILLGGAVIGDTGGVLQIINSQLQSGSTYIHRNNGINILDFDTTSFSDSTGDASTVLLDFETGTQAAIITIVNCFLITFSGGTALRAVTPDLLLNAAISRSTYTGIGTLYSGMSQASNSWVMNHNTGGIPSSNTGGSISLDVTGPPKPVSTTQNTFTDISGIDVTWSSNGDFEKIGLQTAANGTLVYTGTEDDRFTFSGFISYQKSGPATTIQVGIVVNGTPIPGSILTTETGNKLLSLTLTAPTVILSTGDIVKMQIRNLSDSADLDVSYGSLVEIG